MAKEEKDHFVGEKAVWLYLKGRETPIMVVYPSSISLHKAIKMSKGEVDGDTFEVWNGANRVSYDTKAVVAFVCPKDQLNRKSSKVFIDFTIAFENGSKFTMTIANVERMRIIYKQLEPLISKIPSGDNLWLVVPQEQNKFAHIKYTSPISYIKTDLIEDKQ